MDIGVEVMWIKISFLFFILYIISNIVILMIFQDSIKINTNKQFEIVDITSQVNDLLKINNGIVNIFTKHSTSAIVVNENESGLLRDLEFILDEIVSDKFRYQHDFIDNNARSHLKSFLLSSSESIPVNDNNLNLGTWQSVFFIELDGPRNSRTVDVTQIGES